MSAAAVSTSTIQVAAPAGTIRAFEARPSGLASRPGVIVIQEWWGLNDHIKDVSMRLARAGYVAVAPDLYSRFGNAVTTDPQEAGRLMGRLDTQDAIADLLAVVAHLKTAVGVNGERLGVIGFCMGGSYALLLGCHSPDLRAAAAFYGEIPPNQTLRQLRCPLRYFYGDQDGWIQLADVERLRSALREMDKPGEVMIYPGVPHAFFNDTRQDVFRPAQAQDAWDRALRLFAQTLE